MHLHHKNLKYLENMHQISITIILYLIEVDDADTVLLPCHGHPADGAPLPRHLVILEDIIRVRSEIVATTCNEIVYILNVLSIM